MLIILFGLSGSGKNFVGEILAKEFHFYYWDADSALPLDMRQAIVDQEFFTEEMRDQFTANVIEHIVTLQTQHQHLVVSQALYKEKNRLQIYSAFPDVVFLHIQATWGNITARLKKRQGGISYNYAQKISNLFEKPSLPHKAMINNTDQMAIISQFQFELKLR